MPARPVLESEELCPSHGVEQTLVASAMLERLLGPFVRAHGGPGGWLLLLAPELHLEEGELLVPELAGWRWERLPEAPDRMRVALTPDWVCEVLSPETMALDRGLKMLAYGQAGVRHVWLVDPELRTLEVYRHEDEAWSLLGVHEDAQAVHAEPFEKLALDLSALWPR